MPTLVVKTTHVGCRTQACREAYSARVSGGRPASYIQRTAKYHPCSLNASVRLCSRALIVHSSMADVHVHDWMRGRSGIKAALRLFLIWCMRLQRSWSKMAALCNEVPTYGYLSDQSITTQSDVVA